MEPKDLAKILEALVVPGKDYYKQLWCFNLADKTALNFVTFVRGMKFRGLSVSSDADIFPEYTYDGAYRNAKDKLLLMSAKKYLRVFATAHSIIVEVLIHDKELKFDNCSLDVAKLFLEIKDKAATEVESVLQEMLRPPQGPFEDYPQRFTGKEFFESKLFR